MLICKICHLVLLHVILFYVNIRTTETLNRKCFLTSIFFQPLQVFKLPIQNYTPSFTYYIIQKLKGIHVVFSCMVAYTLDYGYKVFLPSSTVSYTHISITINYIMRNFALSLLILPFLINLRNKEFACLYFSFLVLIICIIKHFSLARKVFLEAWHFCEGSLLLVLIT